MKNINKTKYLIKGMKNILPNKTYFLEKIVKKISNIFKSYGFKEIKTPILEYTFLFKKIFNNDKIFLKKEMYTFKYFKNKKLFTLRPENTSSIAKIIINNNLLYKKSKKFWYYGPMFRHEKPQSGRYRQFYQIGVEAIGFKGPDIDAELIIICNKIWKIFNIKNIILEINSIGSLKERLNYNKNLFLFLKKNFNILNKNNKINNLIKILDTKNINILNILNNSPKINYYLNNKSLIHLEKIKKILIKNNICYKINNNLVRGLNYYNNTVFEWIYKNKTICGGGRYDYLFKKIFYKKIPSCGFAIGLDRLFNILNNKKFYFIKKIYDIFCISLNKKSQIKSFIFCEKLRNLGINIIQNYFNINKKKIIYKYIKKANIKKVLFVVIIGNNEIKKNIITIKNMNIINSNYKKQIQLSFNCAIKYLLNKIKKYKLFN